MNETWHKRDVVYVERASNPLGTAAFVLSLISLLSAGTLSILSLILSAVAMGGKPKDLAVSGLVISLVQLPIALGFWWFLITAGYVLNRATSQAAAARPPATVATAQGNLSSASLRVSGAKIAKQPNGRDMMVSLQLQNTSEAAVKRVSLQIEVVDHGESLGKDILKLAIPTRLAPGATRPFEIDLPRYSPLNTELPSTARTVVTVLDAQSE